MTQASRHIVYLILNWKGILSNREKNFFGVAFGSYSLQMSTCRFGRLPTLLPYSLYMTLN